PGNLLRGLLAAPGMARVFVGHLLRQLGTTEAVIAGFANHGSIAARATYFDCLSAFHHFPFQFGGGQRIRTSDTLSSAARFKCAGLSHSPSPPHFPENTQREEWAP